ncbi:carbonic anhydrase [Maridesulfovibrio frigidus]|uniref:carbonic anhydrase n=1 Tax=Maridesulfovibrio frigidus TaxID=340956 RepID=UPI000A4440D6|nr:carbonic anhydrase [Maridesulfovibrio frigidus]
MKSGIRNLRFTLAMLLTIMTVLLIADLSQVYAEKVSPEGVLSLLKDGNKRFYSGNPTHKNTDSIRLNQAGTENQGDHAYATVITCSDSRVPVERVFDAGVMDLFVIRVAGNVVQTDEAGSIEYGLAHVNTPVLVVLGHKQCGAVEAVTSVVQGHSHTFERNIPPLVAPIAPAVKRAMAQHSNIEGNEIVPYAITENVWQSIEDLFMESPATRKLFKSGKVKVVGGIYDVSNGQVEWLSEDKVLSILKKVEANPKRGIYAMAANGKGAVPVPSPDEIAKGPADKHTYPPIKGKPSPSEVIMLLQDGNDRFSSGSTIHPNSGISRMNQSGAESQGKHAYATVITCSDSRIPVERVFDAGVMDLFTVRVAGNVVQTDEAGSIEYGLAHVDTPVLVVLGHTQCGAVAAVTNAVQGHGSELEWNIPPLVAPILPAVQKAISMNPGVKGEEVIPYAIEQNVWQSIEDLFMQSPAARQIVKTGRSKVIGAIYDVATGQVKWLPTGQVMGILTRVEDNPARALNIMDVGDSENSQ